jgi:hypothetical protein
VSTLSAGYSDSNGRSLLWHLLSTPTPRYQDPKVDFYDNRTNLERSKRNHLPTRTF